MSVESDAQTRAPVADAAAAPPAGNPAPLGLATFLPGALSLGLWLVGYLPAGDLGAIAPCRADVVRPVPAGRHDLGDPTRGECGGLHLRRVRRVLAEPRRARRGHHQQLVRADGHERSAADLPAVLAHRVRDPDPGHPAAAAGVHGGLHLRRHRRGAGSDQRPERRGDLREYRGASPCSSSARSSPTSGSTRWARSSVAAPWRWATL